MTDVDTAELVRRAAAGDELAWRQLEDGLGPMLRRVTSAYRLGEAQAADAIAAVWSKLVENIGSLRDGSAVPGWLSTTLRRECIARESELRRQTVEVKLADCERRLGTARQTIAEQDRRIGWLTSEVARLRDAAASALPADYARDAKQFFSVYSISGAR